MDLSEEQIVALLEADFVKELSILPTQLSKFSHTR